MESKLTAPETTIVRLRLYTVSICSIITYRSEAWYLTDEVQRKLNDASTRMAVIITGNSPHEETPRNTHTLDLVKIRIMRSRRLE